MQDIINYKMSIVKNRLTDFNIALDLSTLVKEGTIFPLIKKETPEGEQWFYANEEGEEMYLATFNKENKQSWV